MAAVLAWTLDSEIFTRSNHPSPCTGGRAGAAADSVVTIGGGAIQDTASSSSLIALLAAREKTTKTNSNKAGCSGNLTVYTSSQAHSSIEKAVKIAGIGTDNLRLVKTDKNTHYDIDSVLKLNFNKEDCYFFDINSEERLRIWTLQIQK